MTLDDLKVKRVEKKVVICLLSGSQLSINFDSNDSLALYIITNGKVYHQYITNLIKKHKNVHLIIQFTTILDIVKVLKSIYQIDPTEYIIHTPITIIYDSLEVEKVQLSPEFIGTLQIIRYISLKHQSRILSLQNISEIISIHNIKDVIHLEGLAPKPIYTSTPERFNSLQINLYIPYSWDSWSKVVVLGKSFVLPDSDQIIRDENKLQLLDTNYEKFLNDQGDSGNIIRDFMKPESNIATTIVDTNFTITLSDMLREIVHPSTFE